MNCRLSTSPRREQQAGTCTFQPFANFLSSRSESPMSLRCYFESRDCPTEPPLDCDFGPRSLQQQQMESNALRTRQSTRTGFLKFVLLCRRKLHEPRIQIRDFRQSSRQGNAVAGEVL